MNTRLTIYYDGACPECRQSRVTYTRWLGEQADAVEWFDITGRDADLAALGIDPIRALTELHVKDEAGVVHRELDAYRVLLRRIPRWRWAAWVMGLPVIRPVLSWLYRTWVHRRLKREGRLPGQCTLPPRQ